MTEISEGAHTPWKTLLSKKIYENAWYALRQDQVCTHTGAEITYTFMDHPGAVAVVSVTPEGELIVIKSYRHTVKAWCWEIPMGGRDHEDLEVVARKELKEEVGGICQSLEHISYFYTSNGVSNGRCDVFLARDVVLGSNHPEETELLEIFVYPKDKVFRMARAGEFTDGMSALSLFLCEPYLD